MQSRSHRSRGSIVAIGILALYLIVPQARGQESRDFATRGVTELGGTFSFQSITPVEDGISGGSVSIFTLAPYVGYFVNDGFELGLNPFGITSVSGGRGTEVLILIAPSYNIRTESIATPFLEALMGYASASDGSTANGAAWGFRGGVKLGVTGRGLLNIGVQFLEITENPSGAVNRFGRNEFAFSTGFTVYFK